jgi:hypothetical protein
MSEDSLRSGISAYADQQEHLLGFLSDWVDQDSFDAHANRIGSVNTFGGKLRPLVPGSFILWTARSTGPAPEWLHLAQIMIQLGMIESRKDESGKIWYRAVPG